MLKNWFSSFTSFSNVLEMNSASKHCTPPRGSKRASGLTPMVQGVGDWQTWPAGVTVGFYCSSANNMLALPRICIPSRHDHEAREPFYTTI